MPRYASSLRLKRSRPTIWRRSSRSPTPLSQTFRNSLAGSGPATRSCVRPWTISSGTATSGAGGPSGLQSGRGGGGSRADEPGRLRAAASAIGLNTPPLHGLRCRNARRLPEGARGALLSSPRDHRGRGRSAATLTSHANESARGFQQSIARRSPLARRTPIRPHPDHRVARRPRKQERALDADDAVPCVRLPALAEAAMEGRLPRGFCVKRLTDLPMLWSKQWRAIGLQEPVQAQVEPS